MAVSEKTLVTGLVVCVLLILLQTHAEGRKARGVEGDGRGGSKHHGHHRHHTPGRDPDSPRGTEFSGKPHGSRHHKHGTEPHNPGRPGHSRRPHDPRHHKDGGEPHNPGLLGPSGRPHGLRHHKDGKEPHNPGLLGPNGRPHGPGHHKHAPGKEKQKKDHRQWCKKYIIVGCVAFVVLVVIIGLVAFMRQRKKVIDEVKGANMDVKGVDNNAYVVPVMVTEQK